MKSKGLQKVVFSKYENGESLAKICRDLSSVISCRTIRRWCKAITNTDSINSYKPPDPIRTARKVKDRLKRKQPVSARKLALELDISGWSVRRILKGDWHLKPYKKIVQPPIADAHRTKRCNLQIGYGIILVTTTRCVFFSQMKKMRHIHGVYNAQNERVWTVDRVTANTKSGKIEKRKFSQKVMV
jgi:hypothetical protein